MEPKHLSASHLYNMLQVSSISYPQDFRHTLIFDFRQDFNVCQIRDSFNVHPKNQQSGSQKIKQAIELADRKNRQKEQKYKTLKKVRRYIFIDSQKLDLSDKRILSIISLIKKEHLDCKEDKFYVLGEPLKQFYSKYHFLFLETKRFQGVTDQNQKDKLLLYPYSKFPAQIIPGKLFLGNVFNSNSEKQLNDLGINVLFDFVDYAQDQKIPNFKNNDQKYVYQHLPFNKDVPMEIDFDLINSTIDKCFQKSKESDPDKKILLYCKDGQTISTAFTISFLMYKTNLDIQMASIKVFQAISRVEVAKWIYSQLLIYKPKK